jgi:TetR/AcrR family transcriptional repressor of nem operon
MENRKQQITDLALRLIQEKGYVAISYDDLAKQLGVTKASIHYHFEKKEDLGVAVAERIKNNLQSVLLTIHDDTMTIEDKIAFFATRQIQHIADGICPVSSLQTDYASLPPVLQEKVHELSQIEISIVKQLVGDRNGNEDDDSFALMVLSAIKGAMQYQRVIGIEILPLVLKQIHLAHLK